MYSYINVTLRLCLQATLTLIVFVSWVAGLPHESPTCVGTCTAGNFNGEWQHTDPASSAIEKVVTKVYGANVRAGSTIPRIRSCKPGETSSAETCVSAEYFKEHFIEKQRPVLIYGIKEVVADSSNWNKSDLLGRYGSELPLKVNLGAAYPIEGGNGELEVTMSLSEFVQNHLTDERLLAFEGALNRMTQLAHQSVPVEWQLPARPGIRPHPVLSLGGPRSGISLHEHGESWLLLLVGRKRWFIYPPGRSNRVVRGHTLQGSAAWAEYTLPKLKKKLQPKTFLQMAGDLLYLPSGWTHATVNLDEAMAVGEQFPMTALDAGAMKTGCHQRSLKDLDPGACVMLGQFCDQTPEKCHFLTESKRPASLHFWRKALEAVPSFFPALRYIINSGAPDTIDWAMQHVFRTLLKQEEALLADPAINKIMVAFAWTALARYGEGGWPPEMDQLFHTHMLNCVGNDSIGYDILGVKPP